MLLVPFYWVSVQPASARARHVGPPERGSCLPLMAARRCSSVVRAFAHGAMGRRIGPSWGGPIELFRFPVNAPRLV